MAFYDAFKDAIALAQKADNIELYKQLLDLSAQALDLQAENAKLKEENTELKKKKVVEGQIIRHRDPYITLKDENPQLFYCSHCFDSEHVLVQLHCDYEEGSCYCPHCKTNAFFTVEKGRCSTELSGEDISSYLSFDPYNG